MIFTYTPRPLIRKDTCRALKNAIATLHVNHHQVTRISVDCLPPVQLLMVQLKVYHISAVVERIFTLNEVAVKRLHVQLTSFPKLALRVHVQLKVSN